MFNIKSIASIELSKKKSNNTAVELDTTACANCCYCLQNASEVPTTIIHPQNRLRILHSSVKQPHLLEFFTILLALLQQLERAPTF